MQRRDVLKGGLALAGARMLAGSRPAMAQSAGAADYRALVCVFLFGGNDANNMVVPLDETRHASYRRARPALALERSALVPLGDSGYGAHPAMSALRPLFEAGRAAVVANVGPLMVPTTAAQARSRSVPLPSNLYSHSDQQLTWQSALADTPGRNGWAGRFLERLVAEGVTNRGYSALSLAGSNLWQSGDRGLVPYRVSSSGDFGFDFFDPAGTDPLSVAVSSLLRETQVDPLAHTWVQMMTRSIDNQRILSDALSASALATAFPGSGLGRQLQMAARLIGARHRLGLQRQCFFTSLGGFDTHGDDQLQRQNELLGELAAAMAAFQAAMAELGVEREVTLFTASDFGRTLATNGQGTDHGWGAHQWVLGGSVRGARVVGRFPELAVGGADDVGQGVWVPSLAVDQLAGELGRWFGADEALLDDVLPRLRQFERRIDLMAQA